mmetsp:Transcript_35527/g.79658  ORF Transcript_35527/g.79658 Transcript_35527/m.79658 type:complete len:222 (+) Transcript_35527:393-1058(+)
MLNLRHRRAPPRYQFVPVIRVRNWLVVQLPLHPVNQAPGRPVGMGVFFHHQHTIRADIVRIVDHPLEGSVDAHHFLVAAESVMPVGPADGLGPNPALQSEIQGAVLYGHGHGFLFAASVLPTVGVTLSHGEVRGTENPAANLPPGARIEALLGPLPGPGLKPGFNNLRHGPERRPVVRHRPLPRLSVHPHPGVVTVVILPLNIETEASPAHWRLVKHAAPP